MTRNDLEQAVYRWTNKNASSVDTATQTRIRHFINQRHRRLMGMPLASFLRNGIVSWSSVANQSRYALANVVDVRNLRDLTNDRSLDPMALGEYRGLNPDPSEAPGLPTHWVFMGYEPVAKHPANASSLFIKSTSASDTQTGYVECDLTDGYPRTVSVTLTGTTAVDVSSAVTTAIRVRKFYLSSAAVGVVTLHEDSGTGTELARIGIGQTRQTYYVFDLQPQPSAVNSYETEGELAITDLGADTDEPRLPEDWHYLIELGAKLDEMSKTDDARYALVATELARGEADFAYWLAKQAAGRTAPRGFSRLGAWFPVDTVVR